jgi:hypothetical protein
MPNDELDAISIPELRRRVDHALARLREMRRALAVHAGMTLEQAPGEIPPMGVEQGTVALEQMMATLPLLRTRLTPEERAKLRPVSAARNEQMKEVLDELIADKDAYDDLVTGSDLPFSHEYVVKMRESFDKTDMLAEFEREVRTYIEELRAFQGRLQDQLAKDLASIAGKRGPPS